MSRTPDPLRAGWLVLSVHDVSPLHLADVRWLLGRLDDLGAAPIVLKVVPLEEGTAAIGEDLGLVALLREQLTRGAEVVLHGYTHRAAGPVHGTTLLRLRAALFAGPTAEFLSLSRDEAATRVRAGVAALEALGARPLGFCPPAWLADERLPSILRECGLRYFVTIGALHDLERRRRRTIPALGYMGADVTQERLVAAERRLVMALQRRIPVVRVFLHPQGARRSRACAAVLRTLERLLTVRTPVTYATLLDV